MEDHAATKKLRHKFVPGEGKGCVPCLGFRALWGSFLWRRCVFWMAVHAFSLGCSDAHLPSDSHHRDPNLNLHLPRLHPGASKTSPCFTCLKRLMRLDFSMIFLDVEIVSSKDYVLLDSASIGSQHSQLHGDTRLGRSFHWAMRFRLGIPHPKTCFMSSSWWRRGIRILGCKSG